MEEKFSSLDAQREAAEAYILSQRNQSWKTLPEHYDDGGYSGGNMERPALQRLLADVEVGRIDCIVVYKVDRLSRSLLDFARMMEVLEKRCVSFVSITQQFNTTGSLGRLTLNILLSFAQFERELISERTRDKMSAARRKGQWVGGSPALGYDVALEGGRLVVNESEAGQVREIFSLYLQHRSVLAVAEELNRRQWTTKQWTSKRGQKHSGRPFTKNTVAYILNNVTYTGKVSYVGAVYPGEHAAIVDVHIWDQAQALIKNSETACRKPKEPGSEELLRGVLYCESCQARMFPSHGTRAGRRYRYYVCLRAQQRGWKWCPTKSVSAAQVERTVLDQLRALARDVNDSQLSEQLARFADGQGEPVKPAELIHAAVERVLYDRERGLVRIRLRAPCGAGEVTCKLVRFGHGKQMGRLPRITRLLALAIQCEDLLRSGAVRDYRDLAQVGRVTPGRMTQIMGLLNLAPGIQEQILSLDKILQGRDPVSESSVRRLTRILSWSEQITRWHELMPSQPHSGA